MKTKHFDIDEDACFVCHFIERDTPLLAVDGKTRVDECSLCHKDVQKKFKIYEKEFDHLKYEKELKVSCTNCHFDTVHRGSNVEEKNCYRCHTRIPEEYRGAEKMHLDHVERHKVQCFQCHNGFLHKWSDEYINNVLPERNTVIGMENYTMTSVVTGKKRGVASVNTKKQGSIFDKEPYLIQRKIYAGKGGFGIEGSPDPMYLATVNCTSCHKTKDMSVHPVACNICHQKGFHKTMAEQKEYIARMLASLSKALTESQNRGASRLLIEEAIHNYDLIVKDGSFGVHNIKYVKDLITYSIKRLKSN
ncbi:transcriptional regulator/sugar kinase [Candidatus Scalindua japonica]|uniref:Transcriptional regulator/sugar kinase n=1 Tax=Candidatus Scalindua japonica TaxID=1284222 RepID=A0A286TTU0_9BACT|nr:transcriptional regulator/sugar kinase [Candidatus Scalindua japonica]